MNNLIFDVETIPDWEREAQFQLSPPENCEDAGEWLERTMSTSPEFCKMVGLNWGIDDEPPQSVWVGELVREKSQAVTEEMLLKKFWALAKDAKHLVGFNCLGFDLNVLLVRSAILDIPCSLKLWDEKPWGDHVIDLMVRRFKNVSWKERRGLKTLRRALMDTSVPPFTEYAGFLAHDGADVAAIYKCHENGDPEALKMLKGYGKLDVVTTRQLALHWAGYYW